MSSAKWEIVNGVKFPVEGEDYSPREVERTEVPERSFVYEGFVWDIISEITPDEALEILEDKMNPENSKHYSEMTEDDLRCLAFEEGIPPGSDSSDIREIAQPIVVSISSEEFHTPFGRVKTLPFLELFWRMTGADCPDEEEKFEFPDGKTYGIKLSV
tara:strand:- start:246 stop:719 length:474 start_codon:yes stop_codon:yes gene_type:complete